MVKQELIAITLLALIAIATAGAWWVGTAAGLQLDATLLASVAGVTWVFFAMALRDECTLAAESPTQ